MDAVATIRNSDGFTVFECGGRIIRFKAPYSLERYVDVKHWDDGYLVVMAKYEHSDFPEEEYIDLLPILDDLYIDPQMFLEPIREVKVRYE